MNNDKNESLMDAVAACDLDAVIQCLKDGADPNYTLFKDEDEPNGYIQPTTPLRAVMFYISDGMIDDIKIQQFGEIAKVLLQYGANPGPAMQIAEWRYGKYNPNEKESAFMNVWHIVARASK